ncbi:hypothetical protein BpHYR1_030473 [Brachionus plicatilis]|uniref:Uncharacterized protein n=1 Tax=Brachionus plicatilis TaxID=10195 RepID=A0A3M7PIV2_BRAPC|nr:hypothetical protein BpHYR1_030473 [Brachionus plicatilis]
MATMYVFKEVKPVIEDFWGNLKAKVYEGDWKAENNKQLENKIRTCLSNKDPKVVQYHAKNVRSRPEIIHRVQKVHLC